MIFYGTRSRSLKNSQITNVDCPNCQTNSTMKYSVFGKYAHVYWIPFFPISKITVAECNNCKKTYEFKDLPENIKTKFQREKEKNPVKTPIWMFSGLFVIAGLIGIGSYLSAQTKDKEKDYVNNPKKGDVYEMLIENNHYSTARVDSVDKDSIYVTYNDYETDKATGISEIDVDKNYTLFKGSYTKKMIKNLYEKDSIIAINRN